MLLQSVVAVERQSGSRVCSGTREQQTKHFEGNEPVYIP